tara:strand:- start:193 stop:801 length:609 start_codon:yes stop_codon:yes gene_type:complete
LKYIISSETGWIKDKLITEEIDLLWNYIFDANVNDNFNLVSQIKEDLNLKDIKNNFFSRTIIQYCSAHSFKFGYPGGKKRNSRNHRFCLESFWVNRMKDNVLNPFHNNFGVYSFVIWLDKPTNHYEDYSTTEENYFISESNFEFMFENMLGKKIKYKLQLNKESNGTIIFFPSKSMHGTYQFNNYHNEGIFISGNIEIKPVL